MEKTTAIPHTCEATARVVELEKRLTDVTRELEAIKAMHVRRSERMPSVKKEARAKGEIPALADGNKNREKDSRAKLPKELVRTHVAPEHCTCPKCGAAMQKTGETQDTIVERIPEQLVHRTVVNETRACGCGHEVSSQRPVRAWEQSDFGPKLVAHVVVQKVVDSKPLYRESKALARAGLKIHRNTLVDMFHGAAGALRPIWVRLLDRVADSALVLADETSIKVMALEKCRMAFMWVFLNKEVIAYCFAPGRSGETPRKVLGKSNGNQTILVDAYSGYNQLVRLDGWDRAGCISHGRRKMFEAKDSSPSAITALNFIRWMYVVEHDAEELGIKGTAEHLEMRRTRTLFIFREYYRWLVAERPLHGPQTKMGKAVRYALKQRHAWMRIFRDAAIPLDNNASESALRIVALLRKNALFVGHDESGENHAILLSLAATCQLHGVNPEEYLADVLIRVQTHPAARLDELMPQNWKILFASAPTAD